MIRKSIKKNLLIVAGTISLIIGVIGIVLPLLPTTPLLLLSAYCYLRSSKKLYNRLLNSKRLGPYIKSYMEHKAVKKVVKITALAVLWTSLIISIILVQNIYISILLCLIGIGVSIHLVSLKTI